MLKSYKTNDGTKVYPVIMNYVDNDNLAIELYCKEEDYFEPYAMLSVNIDKLDEDQCYLDTNNFGEAEKFVLENDLGVKTLFTTQSGFCTYPLYKMYLNKLNTQKEFEKENVAY